MIKYVLKRILFFIPIAVGVALLIFTMLYFTPGEPVRAILGNAATDQEIWEFREDLGLNDPFFEQLGRFMKQTFLELDLGASLYSAKTSEGIAASSITDELLVRLPRTAILALGSMIMSVIIGMPLGIIAAVNHNKLSDKLCMIVSMVGISFPQFWVGLMLVLFFALRLGWLPPSGISEGLISYLLPVIAVSMNGIATEARLMRSSLLDVMNADYVTTAIAKGVSRTKAIFTHALPNALIPTITQLGNSFGKMLGGTVVIETVFSIPGIGNYVITAVNRRDYPAVRGSVVFLTILFSAVIVIVDIIYAYIDPRIKAIYEKG